MKLESVDTDFIRTVKIHLVDGSTMIRTSYECGEETFKHDNGMLLVNHLRITGHPNYSPALTWKQVIPSDKVVDVEVVPYQLVA